MNRPKPFIKWVGGKHRLLPELLKRLPETCNTYWEPFLGGGALFWELAYSQYFKKATLIDSNQGLIDSYRCISYIDQLEKLSCLLKQYKYEHSESFYYKVRSYDPGVLDLVGVAARFIYLNKTCFNGLYRVNKSGKFNVPMGRYTDPVIYDADNLFACHLALSNQDVQILYGTYECVEISEMTSPGDVVYFDPPYMPVSKTSNFTSYSSDGFTYKDQVRLRDLCISLRDKNIFFMESNSDCEEVRELYKDFTVETVEVGRSVNSDKSKRGKVKEVIITR